MKYLDAFVRQRARQVPDRDDPDATVKDWSNPVLLDLRGYFEQGSSSEQSDPLRSQAVTLQTLVIKDPDADVRRGDRITQGDHIWTVQGYPSAPRNPFTGRRPGLYVRLLEGVG